MGEENILLLGSVCMSRILSHNLYSLKGLEFLLNTTNRRRHKGRDFTVYQEEMIGKVRNTGLKEVSL